MRPTTVREAMRIVARWHRRHPEMRGAMWALVLLVDQEPEGVITIARPCRELQRGAERLEASRVAVREDLPRIKDEHGKEHANSGCSMLYAAASRAARAMGATDLLTYTHEDEPGSSLRGAGWVKDGHITKDESHDRVNRPRKNAASKKSGRKHRRFAPWSEMLVKSSSATIVKPNSP